ncbi:MAG: hypothetical protein MZW92_54855 [Comamonadaceae bacterium]|nr:hypothetical protein [Comamonadaceae bacterium]
MVNTAGHTLAPGARHACPESPHLPGCLAALPVAAWTRRAADAPPRCCWRRTRRRPSTRRASW